jgi:maleylacetoacetate isomerase
MTDIVLYDYWRSSSAYRVRIALNVKGLAYRAEPVNLLAGEQRSAAHLARNPQGLVPALAIDGRMLGQSLAIVEYLDETRPDPPLLPADAAGRQRVRALAHAIAMEIHPVCNQSVARYAASLTGDEATLKTWMHRFIPPGLAAFETMLGAPETGRFCHGDAVTVADICLASHAVGAKFFGIDLAPYPTANRIVQTCQENDAFARAHPLRQPGAPASV